MSKKRLHLGGKVVHGKVEAIHVLDVVAKAS